jgi:hypothetical protein
MIQAKLDAELRNDFLTGAYNYNMGGWEWA